MIVYWLLRLTAIKIYFELYANISLNFKLQENTEKITSELDWICPMCSFSNNEGSKECQICGSPRPNA